MLAELKHIKPAEDDPIHDVLLRKVQENVAPKIFPSNYNKP